MWLIISAWEREAKREEDEKSEKRRSLEASPRFHITNSSPSLLMQFQSFTQFQNFLRCSYLSSRLGKRELVLGLWKPIIKTFSHLVSWTLEPKSCCMDSQNSCCQPRQRRICVMMAAVVVVMQPLSSLLNSILAAKSVIKPTLFQSQDLRNSLRIVLSGPRVPLHFHYRQNMVLFPSFGWILVLSPPFPKQEPQN